METIALTYRELAERLGIKPESARKTAQRRRWHRTTANDGTTRIHVPVEVLDHPCDSTGDSPPDTAPAVLEERIRGLEILAAELRAQNDDLRADRDRWAAYASRPWWRRLAG